MVKNMRKLREFPYLHLTDRELAILTVAVTELEANGYRPYEDTFVVQVVLGPKDQQIFVFFPSRVGFCPGDV